MRALQGSCDCSSRPLPLPSLAYTLLTLPPLTPTLPTLPTLPTPLLPPLSVHLP